jgi:hypothetical protein
MADRLPNGLQFCSHSARLLVAFSYSIAVAQNAAGGAGNFLLIWDPARISSEGGRDQQ